MNRKQIMTMTAAILSGCAALAGMESTNASISAMVGAMPKGWTVTSHTNAVPYNLSIQPGRPRGIALNFVGSVTVKGPRGINPEKESFILWLMPPDYVAVAPETVAQFEEARLLGTNNTMAVYWTTFTTGAPSWEHWQKDVIQKLGITRAQQRAAPLP